MMGERKIVAQTGVGGEREALTGVREGEKKIVTQTGVGERDRVGEREI